MYSFCVFPKIVSTHSRLKAAGQISVVTDKKRLVSTHSRLKAAENPICIVQIPTEFQHTAA